MQPTTLPARIGTRRTRFLRDADAALTRIREENRRALEQANRQVRIVDSHCPNIVLFLLNGVGYGDLGAYGQQLIKTPIADILACPGHAVYAILCRQSRKRRLARDALQRQVNGSGGASRRRLDRRSRARLHVGRIAVSRRL